jgi:o-succinylbenzoate synthase
MAGDSDSELGYLGFVCRDECDSSRQTKPANWVTKTSNINRSSQRLAIRPTIDGPTRASNLFPNMSVHLQYRPYRRRFIQPLRTHHGSWTDRDGIILRLQTPDGIGYGEIAPIPWFGTETIDQALTYLNQLGDRPCQSQLIATPNTYPATQFALESAQPDRWAIAAQIPDPKPDRLCALLPTGADAIAAWPDLWDKGHRTFKWKIGVESIAQELDLFDQLRQSLPLGATLRLDANGGLDRHTASSWLSHCDRLDSPIEFIEQPLDPLDRAGLIALSQQFVTPIALDESVTQLADLMSWADWPGPLVIKAAIAGSPRQLVELCRDRKRDRTVVFSSVFETVIGRRSVLAFHQELGCDRALGFGVSHWLRTESPIEQALAGDDVESLWNVLAK